MAVDVYCAPILDDYHGNVKAPQRCLRVCDSAVYQHLYGDVTIAGILSEPQAHWGKNKFFQYMCVI